MEELKNKSIKELCDLWVEEDKKLKELDKVSLSQGDDRMNQVDIVRSIRKALKSRNSDCFKDWSKNGYVGNVPHSHHVAPHEYFGV